MFATVYQSNPVFVAVGYMSPLPLILMKDTFVQTLFTHFGILVALEYIGVSYWSGRSFYY
jgi:hypothetical protein